MAVATVDGLGQRLVDGNKAVARVDEPGVLDTVGAIVPVWAVQALVANTIDELVTAIADSRVADIPARVAEEVGQSRKDSLRGGSLERMARMMAVLVANVAR